MHTSSLRLHNITKTFKQGPASVVVLNNITMLFEQGSTYAITGASGAGKSTLLHIAAGLEQPTHGQLFFNDQESRAMTAEAISNLRTFFLGLVFQAPYLISELTVLENVMVKGLIAGMPYDICKDKAYELLTAVGLQEKAATLPAKLSGGQQQRVAITRALFNKPAFLLADEPTGNLDERTGNDLIDFLLDCQAQWGMGLIVSSHDPYVSSKMNRVFHLHNGTLT
jgi:ABC-type lipoprotein export system ATPase subunit